MQWWQILSPVSIVHLINLKQIAAQNHISVPFLKMYASLSLFHNFELALYTKAIVSGGLKSDMKIEEI